MTTTDNFSMNQLGEPDAGKPHVRFDERGVETELRLLRHASTLLKGFLNTMINGLTPAAKPAPDQSHKPDARESGLRLRRQLPAESAR